ncbi:MAG TPA: hypothetical protein VJ650_08530 [Gemmatimonadaceae bacterium]|nr:hypothetical protein [Gemmatimonadaceae bacterium]
MNTTAQETRAHLQVVRNETRAIPFQPPRYAYGFADLSEASRIAALGGYCSIDMVRASLTQGDDEWIIARRGGAVVAAIRVRAEQPWRTYKVDAPVVAEQHQRCGLERYLTHLAELWIQSITLPAAA